MSGRTFLERTFLERTFRANVSCGSLWGIMSWNRTGSTLMQSSGEFRLTEPLSTALVEAALRGDKSGVFRLIGQGSWVEQRDAM